MKNFTYIFFLLLMGCSGKYDEIFLTKEIPSGKVNEVYYSEIKMLEQGIIEDEFCVSSNINNDSGLIVLPNQNDTSKRAHTLTIVKGTPKKTGTYEIKISGIARSGNKKYEKKFKLRILP